MRELQRFFVTGFRRIRGSCNLYNGFMEIVEMEAALVNTEVNK